MRDEIAADSTVPRDIQPDKVPLQIKNGTATIGRFQVGIVEDDPLFGRQLDNDNCWRRHYDHVVPVGMDG